MTFIIEDEGDDGISGDDWSGIVCCPRERVRLDLERKIAEFQISGGQIVEVAAGIMSNSNANFNSSMITNSGSRFSSEEIRAYADRKSKKLNNKIRSGDAESVELLKVYLDNATSSLSLAAQIGCSVDRMQRLLSEYFPEDPRADKFRHKDRDKKKADNEAVLAEKIKLAIASGVAGKTPICRVVHASLASVTRVSKKYKLDVSRRKSGRNAVSV